VTKEDLQKRVERDKKKEKRHAEMPDIVIKVVCRYRAELFFKISRKTKLARLFTAWTERMDARSYVPMIPETAQKSGDMLPKISTAAPVMQFLFTHMGRGLELDQTPEDAGMEDGDEILAVEMMDLTGPDVVRVAYDIAFKLVEAVFRMRFQSRRGFEYKRTGHWILQSRPYRLLFKP
jgi:hypothetical protein